MTWPAAVVAVRPGDDARKSQRRVTRLTDGTRSSSGSKSRISWVTEPSAGADATPSGKVYFFESVLLLKNGFSRKC
jgi:hypothetical protein